MSRLRIDEVVVTYGDVRAVAGATFTAESGQAFAIVGPSGCGKTTLLRAVAGFLRPSSGTIQMGDRVLASPGVFIPPEKRRIGILTQEGTLFPHLSVAQNIAFGLPKRTMDDGTPTADRVAELLSLVGLPDSGHLMPQQLSGGQQQRIALARALAPRPEVILLDEPFSALDAGMRAELRSHVMSVLRRSGTTTILVTHDQEEALSVADRVAFMDQGRIAQVDTPIALYGSPADPSTARFVGDTVELSAECVRDGQALTALGPIPVTTRDSGRGRVFLRPEQLQPTSQESSISGRVVDLTYHGHDSLIEVETLQGLRLTSRVQGAPECALGEDIRLAVLGEGMFFPA